MLYRRLEDQIRELCAKALATPDSEQEFFSVMTQLKAALHEHTKRLRGMSAPKLRIAVVRTGSDLFTDLIFSLCFEPL
jgi:hypothetical protein